MAQSAVAEVLSEEYGEAYGEAHGDDQRNAHEGHSPPKRLTPLYAAALLKVALELRRPEPRRTLDQLLSQVLEGTGVNPEAFRAYLQRNFALVRGT